MNKLCKNCSIEKSKNDFGKNKSKSDGLQTYCKECAKLYAKGYYKQANIKENHIKTVKKRRDELVKENKKLILEYLKTHFCIDCGENDPIVLEFDHLSNKRMNVSRLVLSGYPKQSILDEIDKCVVRCANCHRRKTAIEQGWYKYLSNDKQLCT